jgi:hypothetical protein
MKLSKALDTTYELSGKASDLARQLAFAGIAVIWIFKKEANTLVSIPAEFHFPLLCFVISLTADISQYVLGTIIWTLFHRYYEKKQKNGTKDPDIIAPAFINWPNWTLFTFKIAAVFIGYYCIIKYLKSLWLK